MRMKSMRDCINDALYLVVFSVGAFSEAAPLLPPLSLPGVFPREAFRTKLVSLSGRPTSIQIEATAYPRDALGQL